MLCWSKAITPNTLQNNLKIKFKEISSIQNVTKYMPTLETDPDQNAVFE